MDSQQLFARKGNVEFHLPIETLASLEVLLYSIFFLKQCISWWQFNLLNAVPCEVIHLLSEWLPPPP